MQRNMRTNNYVVVLEPQGKELYVDCNIERANNLDLLPSYSKIVEKALTESEMRTSPLNPEYATGSLCQLFLSKGKITRIHLIDFEQQFPFRPLNEQEYANETKRVLSELPEEFQSYVSKSAWDRGHSSGFRKTKCRKIFKQ